MLAENHPASNLSSLKHELNYQQQLLYFRKKAGAGGKELAVIGLRITRLGLMIVLASRMSPSSQREDNNFAASRS